MASSAISQPSARPSLTVHSTALRFATGNEPGCARQTGHVRVFGSPKYSSSQRQNIFVRVFRCTWISRPTTVSHSAIQHLVSFAHGAFDVAPALDHRDVLFEHAVHLDQPQLTLAGLERELHVPDEYRPRAVKHADVAEEPAAGRNEVRGRIRERPHRSRSGTVSKPSACSSAW